MTATTKSELFAVAAAMAAPPPTLEVYLPSPRDVARQLQDELGGLGHTLKIEWAWSGRNRDGVVSIFDRAQACVYSATYARAQSRWDDIDELLTSCNRGGNMHYALIGALAFLRTLPRRRCGGFSDTLIP